MPMRKPKTALEFKLCRCRLGSKLAQSASRAAGRISKAGPQAAGIKPEARFCRAFDRPGSGPLQDRVDGRAGLRHGIAELGQRLGRIAAAPDQGFQTAGGIGHAKRADRARRTLERMRQCARVGGQGGESAEQTKDAGVRYKEPKGGRARTVARNQ